jgi:hypothetical protein
MDSALATVAVVSHANVHDNLDRLRPPDQYRRPRGQHDCVALAAPKRTYGGNVVALHGLKPQLFIGVGSGVSGPRVIIDFVLAVVLVAVVALLLILNCA